MRSVGVWAAAGWGARQAEKKERSEKTKREGGWGHCLTSLKIVLSTGSVPWEFISTIIKARGLWRSILSRNY
jgi:hypothetical protein